MDIQFQKLELIKMLMETDTSSILEDVRKILSKNTSNKDNVEIKKLLNQSVKEYLSGEIESYEDILKESKEKYFKT